MDTVTGMDTNIKMGVSNYKDGSFKLMTTRNSRKLEHKYMCSCTCVPWRQVLCVFNASVQLILQSWLQSTFVGDPYIKTK